MPLPVLPLAQATARSVADRGGRVSSEGDQAGVLITVSTHKLCTPHSVVNLPCKKPYDYYLAPPKEKGVYAPVDISTHKIFIYKMKVFFFFLEGGFGKPLSPLPFSSLKSFVSTQRSQRFVETVSIKKPPKFLSTLLFFFLRRTKPQKTTRFSKRRARKEGRNPPPGKPTNPKKSKLKTVKRSLPKEFHKVSI